MSDPETAAWYAIGAVARKTGLSVHTLRAWERRYGVVQPQRSGGGTRLYSSGDVSKLRLLRRATEAGHPISRVASLRADELRDLLREELTEEWRPSAGEQRHAEWEAPWLVEELLKSVELMDGQRTHSLLMRAVVALPVRNVVEEVIVPVLRQVGDRWASGTICPAHEHLLSVNVQRVLAWLTDSVPVSADAPVALVTTPAGQWHEMGAQIAGVLATLIGWRVVFLGPSLPVRDIVRAVDVTGARVVLLGVTIADKEQTLEELLTLKSSLPAEVEMVVGGRGAEPFEDALVREGIEHAQSYSELEPLLQQIGGWRVGSTG